MGKGLREEAEPRRECQNLANSSTSARIMFVNSPTTGRFFTHNELASLTLRENRARVCARRACAREDARSVVTSLGGGGRGLQETGAQELTSADSKARIHIVHLATDARYEGEASSKLIPSS